MDSSLPRTPSASSGDARQPLGPTSPPLGTFRSPSTCAPATPPNFGVKCQAYLAPAHQQPPFAPATWKPAARPPRAAPPNPRAAPPQPPLRPQASASTHPGPAHSPAPRPVPPVDCGRGQPSTLPGALCSCTLGLNHGRMGSRPRFSLCGGYRQMRGEGWNVPRGHGLALALWV